MKKFISALLAGVMSVTVLPVFSSAIVRGDANADGVINSSDALCVLQKIVGIEGVNPKLENADINNNGKIDSEDALEVLKICVGDFNCKIAFKKSEILMYTNTQIKITSDDYDLNPANDEIASWKSSDTSLATVSKDGTIKALKAGTATITAKTVYGAQASFKLTIRKSNLDTTKFFCRDTLPHDVVCANSTITIQKAEVTMLDFPSEKSDRVKAEIKITGFKKSDKKGTNNSENTIFTIRIYKDDKLIDVSKKLETGKIKTDEAFTATFNCTLTPGNNYSFDFYS